MSKHSQPLTAILRFNHPGFSTLKAPGPAQPRPDLSGHLSISSSLLMAETSQVDMPTSRICLLFAWFVSLDHPNSCMRLFFDGIGIHIKWCVLVSWGCVSSVYIFFYIMIRSADKYHHIIHYTFEYGGTYPYTHTHSMTVTMDNHRTCHTPCWTIQNTKPFTSWIVSRIIYNTCASNVIEIDFISIRHPGIPRSFSSFTKKLVTQVTFLGGTSSCGVMKAWSRMVDGCCCLFAGKPFCKNPFRQIMTWTLDSTTLPQYVSKLLRRCSNLPSRYDINPQVPSIFIDHIPETGRISMTFAQLFQDKLTQLRQTTTNFIPSADDNP